ncbi:hypothetical protein L1987_86235 [Smallanthus sonchifolius]|uniref:Uncharacterized protein n=1 Tax=Smallanthus sonchifolius TaxID=185202 RepID=A0ACB8XZK9_9ASTR|nr:hypothetical protein L1987_86235 [Smallanthus sonchifolius]
MQAPEHKLVDRNATHTSESNNDAHSDFTTPPKGALKKSHSRKNIESSSDMVGAVDASVSSSKSKRIMNSAQKNSHGKRFQSSADVKNSASVPSSRNKRIMNSVEKDSHGKRFRSSVGVKDLGCNCFVPVS